jgi:hypothetical protein
MVNNNKKQQQHRQSQNWKHKEENVIPQMEVEDQVLQSNNVISIN